MVLRLKTDYTITDWMDEFRTAEMSVDNHQGSICDFGKAMWYNNGAIEPDNPLASRQVYLLHRQK